MKLKNLYIISGKTMSGKSTLVRLLQERLKLSIVKGYTTRDKRYPEEDEYKFVSEETYNAIKRNNNIIMQSEYNGYHYFITSNCLDNKDLMMSNLVGIQQLMKLVEEGKLKRKLKIIFLNMPEEKRTKILKETNNSDKHREKYEESLFNDLSEYSIDITINTGKDLEQSYKELSNYILEQEHINIDSKKSTGVLEPKWA